MNEQTPLTAIPTSAKLGLLGSLHFAQGLPFGFFTQAMPVLMRKSGFSLGQIGLSSLLAMPWALKFLWAPTVDRYWSPRVGRRRSWILPLQIAAVAILIGLALAFGFSVSLMAGSLPILMGAVLLLNLVAATQDIGTDGLAVDILAPSERGLANGLQVGGYRVGMIVGGGVLLVFYDRLGAPVTFFAMAALTALSTVPIGVLREPPPPPGDTASPGAAVHFLRRAGARRVLLVVMTYKMGDAFAIGMLRPFFADAGLGLADIGWLIGTVGFVSGLVGALCGGALMGRLRRRTALVGFGLLQSAAVAGYAGLAMTSPGRRSLFAICGAEHFAGGMATAALFTCMMDWCSARSSATDYTVQASAVVIATGLASAVAGFSAQSLGYFNHFCLATGLSIAALVVVHVAFPGERAARLVRDEAEEMVTCA